MAESPSYDFASRDYTNIRRDLLARAERTVPEWTDRDPSDFGVALVDLWAYMGDILHYYIDRAGAEAFLTTATQRESVMGLANLFDYTPRFRSAAVGEVYVTNTGGASVELPYGTQFSATHNDTLYFLYADETVVIPAGTTLSIGVKEGRLTTGEVLTSGANGQVGQRYTVMSQEVIPSTIRTYVYEDGVNPTEWILTSNINTLPSNTAGFSVYPSSSGEVEVVFGNRLSGRIPPVGAKITVDYATCSGSSGNIPAGKVTGFRNAQQNGLLVANSTAITGGSDGESVESIKRSLRAIVRTQERAVTLQDFADFSSLVAGVYRSVASYTGSTVTIHAMPFIPDYTSYSSMSASVPLSVREEIVDTIQERSLLGVTVAAASSVTLVKLNVTVTVYVKPQYVNNAVNSSVKNAIDGMFELTNLDFGQEIRLGELYRTVMGVDGVDYATVSTFVMKDSNNADVSVLPATSFLRKGDVTVTTVNGITTSV